eukprot:15485332-Alexandrium_andersonii.AAC.1
MAKMPTKLKPDILLGRMTAKKEAHMTELMQQEAGRVTSCPHQTGQAPGCSQLPRRSGTVGRPDRWQFPRLALRGRSTAVAGRRLAVKYLPSHFEIAESPGLLAWDLVVAIDRERKHLTLSTRAI